MQLNRKSTQLEQCIGCRTSIQCNPLNSVGGRVGLASSCLLSRTMSRWRGFSLVVIKVQHCTTVATVAPLLQPKVAIIAGTRLIFHFLAVLPPALLSVAQQCCVEPLPSNGWWMVVLSSWRPMSICHPLLLSWKRCGTDREVWPG